MSKTDKTRPGWVSDFFDGTLTHDHRHGICRVQTFDQARAEASGEYRGHRLRCTRYRWETAPCPAFRRSGECPVATDGRCPGHENRTFDPALACAVCDRIGDRATCERTSDLSWEHLQRRAGGGIANWFRSQLTHRPARRGARDVLHAAAREFNAGYRTDDDHPHLEDAWEPALPNYRDAAWYWC